MSHLFCQFLLASRHSVKKSGIKDKFPNMRFWISYFLVQISFFLGSQLLWFYQLFKQRSASAAWFVLSTWFTYVLINSTNACITIMNAFAHVMAPARDCWSFLRRLLKFGIGFVIHMATTIWVTVLLFRGRRDRKRVGNIFPHSYCAFFISFCARTVVFKIHVEFLIY